MHLNKELTRARIQSIEQPRPSRAAAKFKIPRITIQGDNNLINLGTNGVVKVWKGIQTDLPLGHPVRNAPWPQQILDAIRLKAPRNRRSNERLCELASQVLGRPIVNLERLSAKELARVYQAVCSKHATDGSA
jgi:hypothetical protein